MLAITDLVVRYGMHEALTSVSLQVERDEIVVILGANGAGKSSLLSAVAGNNPGAIEGKITLDGNQLLGLDAAQVVEHGIAFVPEGRGVFADLTVEENLQLGAYAEHARQNEQNNLRNVMSLFPKLGERKKQVVRTMSGGEQQMVAIGRALMSAPSILMLDEPSLGLSPLLCKELFSSLMLVRDSGVGILLVEQNAKQSLNISDRGYLLGNGKIIGQDSAQNLLNDPTVQAAYLGGAVASTSSRVKTVAIDHSVESDQVSPPVSTATQKRIGLSITPNVAHRRSQAASSDSLLDEGIESMVARASSRAAEYRHSDSSLPIQVVKLSGSQTGSTGAKSEQTHVRKLAPSRTPAGLNAIDSPATQDERVQALLAEFETAAKNAISSSSVQSNAVSVTKPRGDADTNHLPLPHIPVYKKSAVTVYRRDGSGTLRKQDK
jgi:branched-chain amino acid transport system ATP-binding protein